MTTYTQHFGLAKPEFDKSTWHDDLNGNFDLIDATLTAVGVYMNIRGLWEEGTTYAVEDRVVDQELSSIWRNTVVHTSAVDVTFEEDRAANPTRWVRVSAGLVPRGQWEPVTIYAVNDIVFDLDEGFVGLCVVEHVSSDETSIRPDVALGRWSALVDLKQSIDTVADYAGQVETMYDEIVAIEQTVLAAEDLVVAALGAYPEGGTTGQALIKQSDDDYDATWAALPGGGDMLQSVYDPEGLGQPITSPSGTIVAFAGQLANVPSGWAACVGGTRSRTTDARLYAAIGTTWGAGNGTTTFGIPDLRDRFLRGHGTLSEALGGYQEGSIESHDHTGSVAAAGAHVHTASAVAGGAHVHTGTANAAGSHNHTGTTTTDSHNHSGSTSADSHSHYVAYSTNGGEYDYGNNLGDVAAISSGRNGRVNTSADSHSHTFTTSTDSHNHTFTTNTVADHTHSITINSAGSHTHTITVDSSGSHTHVVTIGLFGSTETRPMNATVIWIIKL